MDLVSIKKNWKSWLGNSFALRIFIINFCLLILPLIVYLLLLFRYEYENKEEALLLDIKDLTEAKASLFENILQTDQKNLKYLAIAIANLKDDMDFKLITNLLFDVQEGAGYAAVSFYEKVGDEFIAKASTDSSILQKNFSFRSYVQDAVKNGVSHEIAYGGFPHEWPLLFSAFRFEDRGVIVIVSLLQDLLNSLADLNNYLPSAHLSILTEDNQVFFSSNENFFSPLFIDEESTYENIFKQSLSNDNNSNLNKLDLQPYPNFPNGYSINLDKEAFLAVKIKINGFDNYILIDESKSKIYNMFWRDFGKISFLLFLVILFIAFVNIWFIKWLSKPLNQLTFVINQVGKGDLKCSYQKCVNGFEINEVGDKLNNMIVKLAEFINNSKEEKIRRQLLTKELQIGREIQKNILPQEMPRYEGCEMEKFSSYAQEVGGDFFDVYLKDKTTIYPNGKLMITIGDTSGKGISGCLYSFCLRSMLRGYSMRYDDLKVILSLANSLFCLDTYKTSTFVTGLIMDYDSNTKILQLCSAGHPPLILLTASGEIKEFTTKGLALGVIPDTQFETQNLLLKPGDTILVYTNGVTQQINEKGQFYNKINLQKVLLENKDKSLKELVALMEEDFKSFTKGAKNMDDITILMMRCRE